MDPLLPQVDDEQEILLAFFYACPIGILQIDNDGGVQMLNPMVAQLLMPVAPGGVLDNLFAALQRCAPDLRNMVASFVRPRGKICDNHRLFLGDVDGHQRVLSCTMLRLDPKSIMVMLNDVSEQVEQERRLKQADAWITAIFTNVQDFAYFSLDIDGRINWWSPSGLMQTGYSADEVVGRTLDVFHPADELRPGQIADQIECARREGFHLHEGRCVTRGGKIAWWQILVIAVKEDIGTVSGFNVVLRDVTERKMTSDEIRRLLTTDHLTGAANRARLFEAATTEVARWQRHGQPLSVIMLDADHFKLINDKFGHDAGDHVLQTLVARCLPLLRTSDILARYGGEEFVIMLPGTDSAGALALAERVRQAIADTAVNFNGAMIEITVSLGCASMANGLATPDALLKASDVALYRAKQLGRNCCYVFRPGDTQLGDIRLSLGPAAQMAS